MGAFLVSRLNPRIQHPQNDKLVLVSERNDQKGNVCCVFEALSAILNGTPQRGRGYSYNYRSVKQNCTRRKIGKVVS